MSDGAKGVYEGMRCPAKPTELTSLREIKDKLDELKRRLECIVEPVLASFENRLIEAHNLSCVKTAKLDALAESQGKLLAALDDRTMALQQILTKHVAETRDILSGQLEKLDAGLHETAMRNHQQIRALLDEHDSKFTEHFTALFDGNAAVVEKFNEFIDKIKQAAKPRKKARSAVGKAR